MKEKSSIVLLLTAALMTVPLSGFAQKTGNGLQTTARPVRSNVFQGIRPLDQSAFNKTPNIRRVAELGDGTTIYGGLVNANNWNGAQFQITKFQALPNTKFYTVAQDNNIYPVGGGWIEDGKYCFVAYSQSYTGYSGSYLEYDAQTWQPLSATEITNPRCFGMDVSRDPVTGDKYGCMYNYGSNYYCFAKVDYTTQETTTLKTFPLPFWAIAFDAQGQCYGIYGQDAVLYKIDKETGDTTRIAALGLQPNYAQSATIDQQTGKMYWAASLKDGTGLSGLFEINVNNGECTRISSFYHDEEICGLFIPEAAAEASAPAITRDLAITPDGTSQTATLTFTAPTTTFDGSDLSGTLNYTLTANGTTVASGTVESGAEVSREFTVSKDTMYHFVLTTSNATGVSPEAQTDAFIGHDTPLVPAKVTATANATKDTITISWEPVTKGIHGGNVDEPTYKVVRNEDGKVIAEGTTATVAKDTYESDMMQSYSYSVYAVSGSLTSEAASSSSVLVGSSFTIPYNENFASESSFSYFTVINSNNDNYTWSYDAGSSSTKYPAYAMRSDDWLITPPIYFDGQSLYRLTITYTTGFMDENIDLAMGNDTTVNAMTTALLSDTTLKQNTQGATLSVLFKAYGTQHIGLHEKTSGFGGGLSISNISVQAETPLTSPDSVTNLTVTPAAQGATSATVSFNAPTKQLDGNDLSSISKIEVYRGETLVGSVSNATPGETYSVDDNDTGNGFVTYRVVAYNGDNAGLPSEATAYVGIDTPFAPQTVTLTENDDNVTLDWTMSEETKGVNGGYVDPSALTYGLVRSDNLENVYKENINGLTFTDDPAMTGEQQLLYYYVAARSAAGYGNATASNAIVIGDAYKLPFHESFANGNLDNAFWGAEYNGNNGKVALSWTGVGLSSYSSSDGDNGCVEFSPSFSASSSEGVLYTGKISLAGGINPTLSFSCKSNYPASGDYIGIEVYAPGKGTTEVQKINLDNDAAKNWTVYKVNLSDFVNDKYVIVRFHFVSASSTMSIDDVSIKSVVGHDLNVSLSLPGSVKPGTANAKVSVRNLGALTSGEYTVDLLRDGKVVSTADGLALKADSTRTFTFPVTVSVTDPDTITYVARVNSSEDMIDNNNADSASVKVLRPLYPVPSGLTADNGTDGITLSWTKPDLSGGDKVITEGFENYEAFTTTDFGYWTTAGGASATYGIGDGKGGSLSFPHSGEAMAYMVFNPSACGAMESSYDPYSGDTIEQWKPKAGKQYLVAFSDKNKGWDGHDDDWFISPELDGSAQTITFWLKTMDASFGENNYRILYSTTDNDTASFHELTSATAPLDWTEIEQQLPTGTKYFAIQMTNVQLATLIDNVTYTLFNASNLNLIGYNIYRDGEKINDAPVDATTYKDVIADGAGHTYFVTAVYSLGESDVSNEATITTGISSINAEAVKDNVKVYSLGGALIYSGDASKASLPAGAYLINDGNRTVKVTVK